MQLLKNLMVEVVNVVFSIVVAVILFLLIRDYIVQPFQVEGHSMDNTLANGEQMLMFKQTTIDRFDVIVFPDPMGSGSSYVKRVIGLPGDSLSVINDDLYINGALVEEPYLEPLKSQTIDPFTADFSLWDTLGVEVIPEGYYFVMGDNRPNSGDSRQFGLVPIDSVEGEASFIYYPFSEFGQLDNYILEADGSTVSLD
ncbi:signal peptidase I [Fundicoccus culcitae]|uniref:Signal peptidase I n=1 Tax=Fundicoccus culcitae TaxID=2969821 RepID=A0ABY5P7R3_9LACT|nr:signal peptidase I [Fundicoccus culcitae]UUX34425.1 signal peptidase I [Fundicoccus culcitae]